MSVLLVMKPVTVPEHDFQSIYPKYEVQWKADLLVCSKEKLPE